MSLTRQWVGYCPKAVVLSYNSLSQPQPIPYTPLLFCDCGYRLRGTRDAGGRRRGAGGRGCLLVLWGWQWGTQSTVSTEVTATPPHQHITDGYPAPRRAPPAPCGRGAPRGRWVSALWGEGGLGVHSQNHSFAGAAGVTATPTAAAARARLAGTPRGGWRATAVRADANEPTDLVENFFTS